eukprot:TRINITY_DN51784_c0_g1_i1.p1 TRINITY_DN51784_c0_g1~~TRINITY_DN51784_c0_g1_i1.p1  ORF type:complete len:414 (-),score=82.09 TRINITY_DN51784_c0_g1_i1:19-1260(-)
MPLSRRRSLFAFRLHRSADEEAQGEAVRRLLDSRSFDEALRFVPPAESAPTGVQALPAPWQTTEAMPDIERGEALQRSAAAGQQTASVPPAQDGGGADADQYAEPPGDDFLAAGSEALLSRDSVSSASAISSRPTEAAEDAEENSCLEDAFLSVAVEVHPAMNPHEDAPTALRWAAQAFTVLQNPTALDEHSRGDTPLRERTCELSLDEAMRIFSQTVVAANDSLSLNEPSLTCKSAEALLRGMYMLYFRPSRSSNYEDRAVLEPMLLSALALNDLMSYMLRKVFSRARRQVLEKHCGTLLAAVGGISFGVCSRLRKMMHRDGGSASERRRPQARLQAAATSLPDVGALEGEEVSPLVHCPLCRETVLAQQAILNVRAGDAPPECCVCADAKASVSSLSPESLQLLCCSYLIG